MNLPTNPSVFPRLADPAYDTNGIDLHELAALHSFAALLGKFGERYRSGAELDHLAGLAWTAADAFLDQRRDPEPRPVRGVEPSAVELRLLADAISRVPYDQANGSSTLTAIIAKARRMVGIAAEPRPGDTRPGTPGDTLPEGGVS